jgi:hypothetical protein
MVTGIDAAWERENEGPDEDSIFKVLAMHAVNLVVKGLYDLGMLGKMWPGQPVLDPIDKEIAELLREGFKNI